jgi:hypothetical protein
VKEFGFESSTTTSRILAVIFGKLEGGGFAFSQGMIDGALASQYTE